MELFLLLLAAGILFKLARAFSRYLGSSGPGKKRRGREDEKLPPPDAPAKWYNSEEEPSFKGFAIPGGLVYFGGKLLDYSGFNDACLINPHLEISEREESAKPFSMKGLSYGALSPQQRVSYLQWLLEGREDPDCDPGCVLLFFYGLERRLFIDGLRGRLAPEERKSIVLEVLRLLQIYDERLPLRRFFCNLLAMEWVLFGEGAEIPPYLNFPGACGTEVFPAIAARLAARDIPLPAETALQWLMFQAEESSLPQARKHTEHFRLLFLLRYKEKFGKGIPLHPGRVPLILEYCGANPSLGGRLKIRIPSLMNPFVIRAPLQKIASLGVQCAEELEPYNSKLLELKGREDASARALLPPDLLPFSPEGEAIRQKFSNLCASGPALVRLSLLEIILENAVSPEKREGYPGLGKKAEVFGYTLVPDPAGSAVPLSDDPLTALYEGSAVPLPPEEYNLLAALLRLGGLISQAFGRILPAGEDLFRTLIRDDEKLSEDEKKSLQALLLWTFRTPLSARGLRAVLRDFGEEGKEAISRVLLTFALADGTICTAERKQLEKLYSYLGLEKKRISSDLVFLSSGAKASGEGERRVPAARIFERELILLRQEETGEVQKILAGTFKNSGGETGAETEMIEDRETIFPDGKLAEKLPQIEKTENNIPTVTEKKARRS